MRILIVEDDQTIAMGISYSLMQEGFEPEEVYNKNDALKKIEETSYDLYLLDLTLPDGTGYEICKKIKEKGDAPVIFLTACDDEVNVVMGLDMGADDYITKPFRIRELISRIKSVMRRYGGKSNRSIIELGKVKVNLQEAKVYRDQEEIILTALEYRLLVTLINHRGQALSRNQLLEGIWDISGDYVNDNTLTVYIKRLREKLEEDPTNPTVIETVRGIGYRLF
ncbi:MAG TPA: response regulator transcription factor [Candidatus Scybalomonas excrementigallinarum]|jgi:DNA-binding response OmpR family regulator|nr:response regulator transcription factor [Candidatus Scybalomonas excrementigallinarum]